MKDIFHWFNMPFYRFFISDCKSDESKQHQNQPKITDNQYYVKYSYSMTHRRRRRKTTSKKDWIVLG